MTKHAAYSCVTCGEPARIDRWGNRHWTCSSGCTSDAHRQRQLDEMHDGGVHPWTREEIIAALQRDARKRRRPPTQKDWTESLGVGTFHWRDAASRAYRPSIGTVARRFGSWNAALEAAGLPTRAPTRLGVRLWSRDLIIEAIRSEAKRLGRFPTLGEFTSKGAPARRTVYTHCGSWNAAVEAAGFTARPQGRNIV